jgi:hypothetical protein
MPSTPNFGWPTPEDTAQVANGPAIIRALGDAADATVFAQGTAIAAQGTAIAALDNRVTDVETTGFRFVGTRFYFSSGSFEKADPFDDGNPQGLVVRAVRVTAVGGGGGGGGAGATGAGQVSGGGGGAGGSAGVRFILASDLSASEDVTVGSGGAGGVGAQNGAQGESTRFATSEAYEVRGDRGGGSGFAAATATFPIATLAALPQTNNIGDVTFVGGSGSNGLLFANAFNGCFGGNGGPSPFAGGARGQRHTESSGLTGSFPGGGGGGIANIADLPDKTAGAGGAGLCVVEVYV